MICEMVVMFEKPPLVDSGDDVGDEAGASVGGAMEGLTVYLK